MHWLAVNWFWIEIGVAFVALHLFGHGGHGGHGSHRAEDGGARSGRRMITTRPMFTETSMCGGHG